MELQTQFVVYWLYPDGRRRAMKTDTTVRRVAAVPRYEPGRVRRWRIGLRFRIERWTMGLSLTELAGAAFRSYHCFHYAETDSADGSQTYRIDFEPTAAVRGTDFRGSLFFDAATGVLRRWRMELTDTNHPADSSSPFVTEVRFREILPALLLGEWRRDVRSERRDSAHTRPVLVWETRLLQYRFLGAIPGEEPPP